MPTRIRKDIERDQSCPYSRVAPSIRQEEKKDFQKIAFRYKVMQKEYERQENSDDMKNA